MVVLGSLLLLPTPHLVTVRCAHLSPATLLADEGEKHLREARGLAPVATRIYLTGYLSKMTCRCWERRTVELRYVSMLQPNPPVSCLSAMHGAFFPPSCA